MAQEKEHVAEPRRDTTDSEREEETTSCHGPLLSHEEMPDSDDDICEEALDQWERQHACVYPK